MTVGESADALSIEEFLNAVAQYGFVRILPPPGVIYRPVADASPRVIAKGRRCATAVYDLRSIEVASIGGQTSLGASYVPEQVTAYIGGFGPEGAVLCRSPARPQLIEGWQMIRGIGKADVNVGEEANHEMLFVHHSTDLFSARHFPGSVKHRSGAAFCGCRLFASFVVGTRPRMVRRSKRRIVAMYAEWAGSTQHRMMPHPAK